MRMHFYQMKLPDWKNEGEIIVYINLVSDLSEEGHKLHHLLPPRKCQRITRNTRSNKDIFYNFNSRTNRFKFSPIVRML
jgi:hypothetical protein